jgi:hypothetical protein
MELLCVCHQLNQTAMPDYCRCMRCGRTWKYERTQYANDWRCIGAPTPRVDQAGASPAPLHRVVGQTESQETK